MRALVIEDDLDSAELLSQRLREAGLEPVVAQSVEQGLYRAVSDRPAIIFLDLWLDGGPENGSMLLNQLQATPYTAHIPVVLHSAYLGQLPQLVEFHLSTFRPAGMLPKPLDAAQLQRLLAQLLPPGDGPATASL